MSGEEKKKTIQSSLKKIINDPLIRKVFSDAVEGRSRLRIRFRDGQLFEARVLGMTDTRIEFEFRLPHERNRLHRNLRIRYWDRGEPTPESVFSLTLRNSNTYLFSSSIVSDSLEKWSFPIPAVIQQVVRRKHFRYVIPLAYEILVQMPHPIRRNERLVGTLHDISRGGLAVKIPYLLHTEFVVGKTRSGLHFKLEGAEVSATAVVRSVRRAIPRNQEGPVALIGFEFENLEPEAESVISAYLDAKLLEIQSGSASEFQG